MATECIVIKINEQGKSWEDTRPVENVVVKANTIETVRLEARRMAQYHANCTGQEVRWNIAGSYQGHYVQPQAEVDEASCVGRRLGPVLADLADLE